MRAFLKGHSQYAQLARYNVPQLLGRKQSNPPSKSYKILALIKRSLLGAPRLPIKHSVDLYQNAQVRCGWDPHTNKIIDQSETNQHKAICFLLNFQGVYGMLKAQDKFIVKRQDHQKQLQRKKVTICIKKKKFVLQPIPNDVKQK